MSHNQIYQPFYVKFLVFLVIVGGSVIGASVVISCYQNEKWYEGLTHPSYSPAAWVIAPVFTLCFLLEALGAWFVWYANGIRHSYPHILIYCAQYACTLAWFPTFFGYEFTMAGIVVLIGSWTLTVLTLLAFSRCAWLAAVLFAFPLAWKTYGLIWGMDVMINNPGR